MARAKSKAEKAKGAKAAQVGREHGTFNAGFVPTGTPAVTEKAKAKAAKEAYVPDMTPTPRPPSQEAGAPQIPAWVIYRGGDQKCVYLDKAAAEAALKPGQEIREEMVDDFRTPVIQPTVETRKAVDKALEGVARGKMTVTDAAMVNWGLEPRHIMASREYKQPDGSTEVAILTHGGQRLRWPQDAGRVLSAMEKGDAVPQAPAAGIFKAKA